MTTRNIGPALGWLLIVSSVLFAAACGKDQICGSGTRLEDGLCIPVCAPGTELNSETGHCASICVEGTYRDPETGGCLPHGTDCVSGEVWDFEAEGCIEIASLCSSGSTWVASERTCVPDHALRVPDYQEGTGENDPGFGSDFEWFDLPDVGGTVSIGGTVDSPRDKDGSGALNPDFDLWLFEVDEPMLLRVTADGIGGSTSGFMALSIEPSFQWLRFGIGTTSSDTTRDIYLPHPGLYGIFMTDALNFVADPMGPFHGGGDMGYFVEFERMPIPEPTPLTFEDDLILHHGEWSSEVPEEGSMLSFYSVEIEPRSMFWFQIDKGPGDVGAELLVSGNRDLFITDDFGNLHGFVDGESLLIVADYSHNFAFSSVPHTVVVERFPATWIGDERIELTFDQPEWNFSEALPAAWYGFEAEVLEIVTVHMDSSTGHTCLDLYDAGFNWVFERINCTVIDQLSLHRAEARLIAPYSGFYGVTTIDWDGALHDQNVTYHIPAHEYDVSLRVSRQMPDFLGSFGGAISAGGELDELMTESFFVIQSQPGDLVAGWVEGELDAEASIYLPHTGTLRRLSESEGDRFVWRSFEGGSGLFGVRERSGNEGSFELHLEPLVVTDLGPVSTGAGLHEQITLPAGSKRAFLRILVDEPGLVSAHAAMHPDLEVTIRNLDLTPVHGPYDLPKAFEHPANEDGLFLEISTIDGSPLADDATVFLTGSLAAALDVEPGYGQMDSPVVELPVTIAGRFDDYDDIDWYAFQIPERSRFIASVLPRGIGGPGDTLMAVFDGGGDDLALDDDSGPGGYSAIDVVIEHPGTYYLAVRAFRYEASEYLLELRAELP